MITLRPRIQHERPAAQPSGERAGVHANPVSPDVITGNVKGGELNVSGEQESPRVTETNRLLESAGSPLRFGSLFIDELANLRVIVGVLPEHFYKKLEDGRPNVHLVTDKVNLDPDKPLFGRPSHVKSSGGQDQIWLETINLDGSHQGRLADIPPMSEDYIQKIKAGQEKERKDHGFDESTYPETNAVKIFRRGIVMYLPPYFTQIFSSTDSSGSDDRKPFAMPRSLDDVADQIDDADRFGKLLSGGSGDNGDITPPPTSEQPGEDDEEGRAKALFNDHLIRQTSDEKINIRDLVTARIKKRDRWAMDFELDDNYIDPPHTTSIDTALDDAQRLLSADKKAGSKKPYETLATRLGKTLGEYAVKQYTERVPENVRAHAAVVKKAVRTTQQRYTPLVADVIHDVKDVVVTETRSYPEKTVSEIASLAMATAVTSSEPLRNVLREDIRTVYEKRAKAYAGISSVIKKIIFEDDQDPVVKKAA